MNQAKMKALMALIDTMNDNVVGDMKGMKEDKPDVKITKVAVIPKEDEEMEKDNSDVPSLEKMLPKEGDEDDVLAKLRKKFTGK